MAPTSAVNRPTDVKVKEQDVNAKLQLYGIYAAFAKGKVPSNKQIDVALNSALEWQYLRSPSKKLSAEGRSLVADLRDVIESAKVLLLSKNQGNLLQDFIWQTQHIAGGDSGIAAPVDKNTAQQHGDQALDGLRTLGQLLLTNGQFRKLLSDATILLRDIAGDGAQKIANQVAPSEDELSQIDRPAEDNVWHDAPNLSKDNIKKQLLAKSPLSKSDVKDIAGDATQAAHPSGSRDPADAANLAAERGADSGLNAQKGLSAGAQALKQKVSDNVDEDDKQQAREYRAQVKNYFKGKVPKDRREQVIFRLKKMIVEIQGHRDYQQAVETLLRLAEEYTHHSRNVVAQGTGAVKDVHGQDTLQNAESDLKTLLERFANGTSFDDLFNAINQIYTDADSDPELKGFFKDADKFIRKLLLEQGFVLQDDANGEWNQLYDRGNYLLRERYRNHTDRIADEFNFLADQFDQDPQNKAFANSLQKLFTDLGTDENGVPAFKPHLIKDLSEVILPGFFEHVRYIPVPRIEYSDPSMDAIVENLVIEGDNLAPNVLEFASDNFWRWGRKGNASHNKNKVMLSVSGVQMDLRDVSYYVNRKQGFPSITDKGIMDVFLGGSGLSFKVAMETADKADTHHFFKINTVKVEVKNMNIKLKKSSHKLLFTIFKPLLFKILRPVIEKAVEKEIRDRVHQLDAFLFKVKAEVDRAVEEAKNNPDPEELQNIFQRYFTAFQQQLAKAKKAKEEHLDNKTVNVAVNQHDSIFKNIDLPGGISTKATDYKELAAKGEAWESPVFSIGSAKESTSIPAVGEPTRKPHRATESKLRSGTGLDGTGANSSGAANATHEDVIGFRTSLGQTNPVLAGTA